MDAGDWLVVRLLAVLAAMLIVGVGLGLFERVWGWIVEAVLELFIVIVETSFGWREGDGDP